jgi:predicted molibdopterin-dependent oxidoreductase YjgC
MNDVFIVTGSNTGENHPIIALQMKEAVQKYGAKMIVIDPRRIDLVDFAEMWLPLKVGTNVPVFSAMAHVIVKEGLVNNDFVAKRTEGFQDFVESLEKFTPEYAEELSGVPPRIFAKRRACMPRRRTARSIGAWASRNFRMEPPARWRSSIWRSSRVTSGATARD